YYSSVIPINIGQNITFNQANISGTNEDTDTHSTTKQSADIRTNRNNVFVTVTGKSSGSSISLAWTGTQFEVLGPELSEGRCYVDFSGWGKTEFAVRLGHQAEYTVLGRVYDVTEGHLIGEVQLKNIYREGSFITHIAGGNFQGQIDNVTLKAGHTYIAGVTTNLAVKGDYVILDTGPQISRVASNTNKCHTTWDEINIIWN
ncbi:hypothetical protein DRO38_07565, partial [Candidatus Bathyarchaeota archaeon]